MTNRWTAAERDVIDAAMTSGNPLERANAGLAVMTDVGFRPSSREASRIIALRLASPKRADPGRVIVDQADAGHLPLFGAANEQVLL